MNEQQPQVRVSWSAGARREVEQLAIAYPNRMREIGEIVFRHTVAYRLRERRRGLNITVTAFDVRQIWREVERDADRNQLVPRTQTGAAQ